MKPTLRSALRLALLPFLFPLVTLRRKAAPTAGRSWRIAVIVGVVGLMLPNAGHAAAELSSPERDLVTAVRTLDQVTWRALMKNQPDLGARDERGNSALHFAALNHDLPAVQALLAAGADASASNTAGATPLLYGAGHSGIVAALLERGANPNAVSAAGGTPLMAAVAHPASYDAVRLLIEAGADVRAAFGPEESVMLNRAFFAGDKRTIELLLTRGAIVNPKTGPAPLTFAAVTGNVATVRMLLDRGVAPDYNSDFAGHALNWALYSDHPDVARLMIEHGADPHFPSPWGHSTPPMVWAGYPQDGDSAVAKALVAAGVNVNAVSDTGASALSYALRNGADKPLVQYLRSIGAKEPAAERLKKIPRRDVPTDPAARVTYIREQLQPTLDLLQKSSTAFLQNGKVRSSNCISCHQQDLPAVALELGRARGFRVDDLQLGQQLAAHLAMWNDGDRPRTEIARQMLEEAVPDAPVGPGYGFMALAASRYTRDDSTDAMAHYLLRAQRTNGSWFSYD